MKIIGLTGPAGAGKSSVAAAIVAASHVPACVASFAEPMKRMLFTLLASMSGDVEGAHALLTLHKDEPTPLLLGKTPRQALQTLGTEWGRTHIHPMFWVEATFRAAKVRGFSHIVIDDVRLDNEVEAVAYRSGRVIELYRPGYDFGIDHITAQRPQYIGEVPVVRNDTTPEEAAARILTELRDYWV